MLIPHGESASIVSFLTDVETGYKPTQHYVYEINPYAKMFMDNLPKNADLKTCNPETEVIHPMKYKMKGWDKIGAFLIFEGNHGWWCGSIMDDSDASKLLGAKYGPTVLQVASSVFSAFVWACKNNNKGPNWPEYLDTDEVLDGAKALLGNVYSDYVDVSKTWVKDCYKFEDFIADSCK